MLRRVLQPTNRRVRILVGLLLAGLFCVQCTRTTEALPEQHTVTVISGKVTGSPSLEKIESLARSSHADLLRYCIENYGQTYRDYTCTFHKQERIGGNLGREQVIGVKFMEQPFSVAMNWLKNKPTAERIIYVEGKYDNQMLVKPNLPFAGLIGTVMRPPDGEDARRQSLRTVNQFGFKRSMESLLEVYEQARQAGDLKEEFCGYRSYEGRNTLMLVRMLPDTPTYPAFKTVTYIDVAYLVPVAVEAFSADGELCSRYVYEDVKFNVGLKADDFLPEANGMAPPR